MNDQNERISGDSLQFYIYVYLAYDLLNLAVITHFFQWLDGINALVSIHKISLLQSRSQAPSRQQLRLEHLHSSQQMPDSS
jgi:hypothetical protein